MKTREQKAGEMYASARDLVTANDTNIWRLAQHVVLMVNGTIDYEGPLWTDREFADKAIHLDRFEDYLLLPPREGLGVPSLSFLLDNIKHCEKGPEALAILRREIEGFDARVAEERARASVAVVHQSETHGGARPGAGRKPDRENQGENFPLKRERKTGSASPERIIARLKRDAFNGGPKLSSNAKRLLKAIEANECSARQAGLEMGYIKPADSAQIVSKHVQNLTAEELLELHRDLSRSLPDGAVDHLKAAKDAYLSLTAEEAMQFMEWANSVTWESAA